MNSVIRKKILPHTALILLSVLFAFPFIWLLSTSLKTTQEIFRVPPDIIPRSIQWKNYEMAVSEIPFFSYTFNTLFVTGMSIIGQLFASTLVAYSVSLVEWKGKKLVFGLILSTMMIPIQVTMVPVYIVFSKLHLVGSFWPLIIPTFTGAPLYIFLLRQFYMGIPQSLLAAAKIDGATELRTFVQIVLPLCKPAVASVAVVTFLYTWSDFLGPLIYLNKQEMFTLTLGLQGFLGQHTVEWNKLMAASALFTFPVIMLFFVAQKQFIQGITLTGVKG